MCESAFNYGITAKNVASFLTYADIKSSIEWVKDRNVYWLSTTLDEIASVFPLIREYMFVNGALTSIMCVHFLVFHNRNKKMSNWLSENTKNESNQIRIQ